MGWGRTGRDPTGWFGITLRIPSFGARKSRSRKLIPNVRERFAERDRTGCTRGQRELGRKFCRDSGDHNKNLLLVINREKIIAINQ